MDQHCICLFREIDFWGTAWDNGRNWIVCFPCEDGPGGTRAGQREWR